MLLRVPSSSKPPASGPSSPEPHVRGTVVGGAFSAVADLWSDDGIREVSEQLSPAARAGLCDRIVLPVAWYPEASFREWCEAVWHGPAREDEAAFARFVRRSVDLGWSWVHRALVRIATPALLARRAPTIWRHDHTHGDMSVTLGERCGTLRVTRYPHARSAVMRRGQTESLRYILTLARVADVRASHAMEGGDVFVVTLRWR
jgi:hypothetical protein